MVTKVLVDSGLKVAVIKSGPHFDPANPDQQTQFKWAHESPRRGASTQRDFGEYDMAYGGWDIEGEPYNRIGDTQFDWYRSGAVEVKQTLDRVIDKSDSNIKLNYKKYA